MAKKKDNFFLLLIGLGILYLIYQNSKDKDTDIHINNYHNRPRRNLRRHNRRHHKPKIEEPKKYYDSKYMDREDMEINVPTRGEPPEYQQVGILSGEGEENIKPLYGRQTYRGSNQWNYFTSLDSHLATKIPVYIGGEDCTEERGCKEINKGDIVDMGDTGDRHFKASIYKTAAPRYIPNVL